MRKHEEVELDAMTGNCCQTAASVAAEGAVCLPGVRHSCMCDVPAYFSLRQFTEARFSTVLDSIWMSKPLRSRYFSIITWPVPSSDTP